MWQASEERVLDSRRGSGLFDLSWSTRWDLAVVSMMCLVGAETKVQAVGVLEGTVV